MNRILVTLCTYNERDNLPRLLRRLFEAVPHADVLIVDDASPDGTGALAEEWAADDARIHVMHRTGKLGIGSATLAAFRRGLAEDYQYTFLVNMDADLSHSPEAIPQLLALMDNVDVAIGSRYVPGGQIQGWGPRRHVMSRCVNWLTRLLLGLEPRDTSGSFRCYRTELLEEVPFDRIISHGYAFEEEILFRCAQAGARFAETPICFEDRQAGESKISVIEIAAALRDLGRLALEYRITGVASTAPTEVPAPIGGNP